MPKVLIIGDDMTGVNSSAVLLARQGLNCATFFDLEDYTPEESNKLDVVIISTDSRSIDAKEAYARVDRAIRKTYASDVLLVNKRIDSTLRGNIGAELLAILDYLPEGTMALVVPVFPASGRVCIGGYLMVDQVPLEQTIVAKDPKNPICTSKVLPLVQKQLDEPVGFIELSTVLQGSPAVEAELQRYHQEKCRIVVADATTNQNVEDIAKAAKASGISLVAVDPGPFTSALAAEMIAAKPAVRGQKVLLTVGSVTEKTRRQLDDLRLKYTHHLIPVSVRKLIAPAERQEEILRVAKMLVQHPAECEVLGIITSCRDGDVLDLNEVARAEQTSKDEISQRIATGLAEITVRVIEELGDYIGGLFTSGGDVTVAVCDALQSICIEVKDEILPLAVYGRLHKGNFDHRPIVTKGGLIGDDSAISKCVEYLLIKLSNEKYNK